MRNETLTKDKCLEEKCLFKIAGRNTSKKAVFNLRMYTQADGLGGVRDNRNNRNGNGSSSNSSHCHTVGVPWSILREQEGEGGWTLFHIYE
ncbi:hypothetical protein GN956_G11885 [Arapaima gigas]